VSTRDQGYEESKTKGRTTLVCVSVLIIFVMVGWGAKQAFTQSAVFDISLEQSKIVSNKYPLQCVLEAGGQFWTTPFTRYTKATNTGDGYGEGPTGPRSQQRKSFNPTGFPEYPFLRLNGLDSQSCYECHNSIGSDPGYGAASPLIRKQPSTVGGSAGFNSNAFINPCFPTPLTLLIRQPPHVFGTAYVQTIGDEITEELYNLRCQARKAAANAPGVPQTVTLEDKKHGLSFGTFTTTFTKGGKTWRVVGDNNSCTSNVCKTPAAPPQLPELDPCAVEAAGFTDDAAGVKGVAFDLIIRPFQWKGISSSIRHFVRDALDFHFSMQAVEKVGSCDCDMDGKTNEVTIGNVSAITSFVGMTRPPQQISPPGQEGKVKRGYEIFTGTLAELKPKLQGSMCATCHVPSLPIVKPKPQFVIDGAVGNNDPNCKTDCPFEATGGYTSLIAPLPSYAFLPVLQRIRGTSPTRPYLIPLDSTDVPPYALPRLSQTAPSFLPFLPPPPKGALYVPLFSDLKTHDMGTTLADLSPQGADVAGVCIAPRNFLTRPLWGVADTGPWLHDGRATSLLQAILLHGNSTTGSEAGPIIDAFERLSPSDQDAVVSFLLTLRLPTEQGAATPSSCKY